MHLVRHKRLITEKTVRNGLKHKQPIHQSLTIQSGQAWKPRSPQKTGVKRCSQLELGQLLLIRQQFRKHRKDHQELSRT